MRRYRLALLWRSTPNGYRLPGVLFSKGEVLELVGKWDTAAAIYQGNIDLVGKTGDEQVLADNLLRLGAVLRNQGQYDRAVGLLEQAAELFGDIEDEFQKGRTLGIIGSILGDRQDLTKSWEYYERQGRSGNERIRGMAACNKGVNCIKSGEFDRAWQYLSESLACFRRIGDRRTESMVLNNMGLVRKNQGDLDGAERLYCEALGMALEIGDLEGIDRLTGTIGVIAKLRGRFGEARYSYLRQLEIAERIGDYKGYTNALLCLGILSAELDQPALALEYFEKRLAIETKTGDVAGTCYTLGNMGLLYRQMGETVRSNEYLENAIAQCRATGQRSLLANYLHGLASGLATDGKNGEAKKLVGESLAISTELGLAENAFNCRVLAARLRAGEEKEKALRELSELSAEAASPAQRATVAYEEALITNKQEDIRAALALYEELCAVNPRLEWKRIVEELKQMTSGMK